VNRRGSPVKRVNVLLELNAVTAQYRLARI
jgi:hypothetical protein